MTSVYQIQYTNAGLTALLNEKNQGLKGEISHIAVGSAAYAPTGNEVQLREEQQRVEVQDFQQVNNTLHIASVFSGELSYNVFEIGVFLKDGTLLGLASDPSAQIAHKPAGGVYMPQLALSLSQLPNDSITVEVSANALNLLIVEDLTVIAIAITDLNKRHLDNFFKINALRDFIDSQIVSIKELIQQKYDDVLGGVGEAGNTLKKLYDLIENVKLSLLPRYAIIMWARPVDEIPDGFKLCDGENGTPNLIDKFIKSSSVAGQTGGSNTHTHSDSFAVNNHTLSASQMPSHSHSIANVYQVTDSSSGGDVIARISGSKSTGATGGSASHGHTLSGEIDASSNEPEYYTMCLIMKI